MPWPSPTRALSRRSDPLPAERFGLDAAAAEAIVRQVEAQYLGPHPSGSARRKFRSTLHLEDLLLARACAAGIEAAWETFWRHFQPRLRRAALALTHEPSRAHELADSLLAELFGMQVRDGQRVSKLNSFTGIGSLEGWLIALLARAQVDTWRRERRTVSLEASIEASLESAGSLQAHVAPAAFLGAAQPQIEAALETVLGKVDETARLLLSLYFLDGKTLAEIGALLQVHESTISRRLDRVLVRVRRATRRELGRRGLAPAAWEETAELDPRHLQVDVRKALGTAAPTTGAPHGS